MTDVFVDVAEALVFEANVTEALVVEVSVEGGVAGPMGSSTIAMTIRNDLFVGVGVIPYPFTHNQKILQVMVAVAIAPTGDSDIFDVRIGATSIFTSEFPEVLPGAKVSQVVDVDFDVLAGQSAFADVLNIGSPVPGAFATIVLVVQ